MANISGDSNEVTATHGYQKRRSKKGGDFVQKDTAFTLS